MRRFLLPAAALALGSLGLLAQEAGQREQPAASDLEERVRVELVEVKVRVVDRKGLPVTDVLEEEVAVEEGGRAVKLAYFEPVSESGGTLFEAGELARPGPVYDSATGEALALPDVPVVPATPVRRIVFAFDPASSRLDAREDWRKAALEWVSSGMREDDRVAVVLLRGTPQWVAEPTTDRERVRQALHAVDLYTDTPSRSRRDEMLEILTDLRGLCLTQTGGQRGAPGSSDPALEMTSDSISCAYELLRPWVDEWKVQSEASVDMLRALAGELAAIPGQKTVILFSEGLIDHPGEVAVNTMFAVLGAGSMNAASMSGRLADTVHYALGDLYHITAASDVVFFTMDTRHPSEGGSFNNLEFADPIGSGLSAYDPFREIYQASRAPLTALAHATGGKPFYGRDALSWKVRAAADSFFGLYNLGYYRDTERGGGKLKIRIQRKGVEAEYNKEPRRVHEPLRARIDLQIGRPEPTGGGLQRLPVLLLMPAELLPLRRGGGGRGCELGLHLQAARPDGTIVGEAFETLAVVLDREQREAAETFRHMLAVDLPDGPVRLRARVSDDRQAILGDRSLDLTVGPGEVRAGLHGEPRVEPAADSELR